MIRILFFFLGLISPLFLYAEDDFRVYKKPLLPGVEIAQTDTHTELIYKGQVIKKYVNTEFAIELLPYGPNEEPDCYNSLVREVPSSRAKNIIGKDYLRSCLVLQTRLLRNRYILFYGPAIDGNKVSLYDIRKKKFFHGIANNVIDVKATLQGQVLFLVQHLGKYCQRSIVSYKDDITQTLFDDCSLKSSGIPLIRIDRMRVLPKRLMIYYTPYQTDVSGNTTLSTKKSIKTLTF